MIENGYHHGRRFDWSSIAIYLILVVFGWISIYSSTYSGEDAHFFDISYRYGMQLVWISVSLLGGLVILFLDSLYYFKLAPVVYLLGVVFMIAAAVFGKEINGAKSWLALGPVSFQPVEFMKIGTALLVSRIVYCNFENRRVMITKYLIAVMIPVMLTILQNDTGSALVFSIFFLVLYREGTDSKIYILMFIAAIVLILSFVLDREVLLLLIFLLFIALFANLNGRWKVSLRYAAVVLLSVLLLSVLFYILGQEFSMLLALFSVLLLSIPFFAIYKKVYFRDHLWSVAGICLAAMSLCFLVDVAFNNVLKPHQQLRILDLFGICSDPKGISYNVTQSKIAIGSGGVTGKGFLNGTQTQYSYVPEQETDFIFCTVGEEEGFVGTAAVVILFSFLVLRLMVMAERASTSFGRAYCYCAAGIFFFHFVVNISMTIGLFPVVGIPLPFFSYGGSSFLCFTALLFIALRLDLKQDMDNF